MQNRETPGGIAGRAGAEVLTQKNNNTLTTVKQPLKTASLLAAQGIPSFPCAADKSPTCPGGFKAATKNPDHLRKLFTQYPADLIGVPTGIVSGIDVVDVDPKNGGDKWLAGHAEKLPETRINGTRSGGQHILLKHHTGLRNSASKIALGVDTRCDGGYIIWWPAAGFPVLSDAPPAPWPDWLLSILIPAPKPRISLPRTDFKGGSAYASAALRGAVQSVACAGQGSRNDTLNREAYSLARFIESGDLPASVIAKALAEAALAAGLTNGEIAKTLASALRARGI